MDKFEIKFSKIKHGWINIYIFINGKHLKTIHGSGVFNPFYEINDILKNIKNRKNVEWEIDEEGTITTIHIKNIGKLIKLSIDNNKFFIINKKDFLKEMKTKLNKLRKAKEYRYNDIFYSFEFREIK